MKVFLYRRPWVTKWLGWIESCRGKCIAFIRLDGSVVWDW